MIAIFVVVPVLSAALTALALLPPRRPMSNWYRSFLLETP